MMAVETTGNLTPALLDLMDHEKVIEQGLASFIDVGMALLAIKADKKYRHAGYSTFEDYCDQRWNIDRRHGNRLVLAASTATAVLGPIGPIPEREAQVRPLTLLKDDDDKRAAWAEAVEQADSGQPTAKQVEAAVTKRQPPKKDHPAPFSDPILEMIAKHVGPVGTVLDPFAGTGRVHELRERAGVGRTIGVEIEPEWAAKHPDTIEGNALDLASIVEPGSVDAIATSPTYGNRMADHHNATDDSVRLTYKHTLGHDLAVDNSGAMAWGDEYREFHRKAWQGSVTALKAGGTFTLNIKNYFRKDEEQHVAAWHLQTLWDLGMTLEKISIVGTRGIAAGANNEIRADGEFVATFRKGEQ